MIFGNDDADQCFKSKKSYRTALHRGMLSESFSTPSSHEPVLKRTENLPSWVQELDDLIASLDAETCQTTEQTPSLDRVRTLLTQMWPCIESMAAACSDGDERWILQRNRLFAALFRVLERRDAHVRIAAARCVLRLLGAGRASALPSLQVLPFCVFIYVFRGRLSEPNACLKRPTSSPSMRLPCARFSSSSPRPLATMRRSFQQARCSPCLPCLRPKRLSSFPARGVLEARSPPPPQPPPMLPSSSPVRSKTYPRRRRPSSALAPSEASPPFAFCCAVQAKCFWRAAAERSRPSPRVEAARSRRRTRRRSTLSF